MKEVGPGKNELCKAGPPWAWMLAVACLLVVLIAVLSPRPNANSRGSSPATSAASSAAHSSDFPSPAPGRRDPIPRFDGPSEPASTAEQIVARRLAQFGKSRRELVHAIAKHFKLEVPDDVERFFAAVEGGRWEEINAVHDALLQPGEGLNQPRSAELHQIWRSIQETWGAAREAHDWPAQRLLDYGDAVLGSLKPGMIYVGGTDPGCFIPTFLNETSDGERHITLTQNALADGTYLDYLNFLYGGQMNTLTQDDSQRAFQDYMTDAQKRLQHDQQFPDEPKQLRPGEDVRETDGRVQVAGQLAVMAINEKLFQKLMEKNPDATFALEESFPFRSTYANAAPLGPIMELRVDDPKNAWTAERATESVDYWRGIAEQLRTNPEVPNADDDPRKAYSKMACAQAALLLNHNYPSEAEQAYRIADEMCGTSPEVVFGYVQMLVDQKRFADAIPVVENALRADPEQKQFQDLLERVRSLK